jgi:hypothetical protein
MDGDRNICSLTFTNGFYLQTVSKYYNFSLRFPNGLHLKTISKGYRKNFANGC